MIYLLVVSILAHQFQTLDTIKLCSEIADKEGTACLDSYCASINIDYPLLCISCQEGYELTNEFICVSSDEIDCFDLIYCCDRCDSSNPRKCSVCSYEYVLLLDGTCGYSPKCNEIFSNCDQCERNINHVYKCTKCEEDYQLTYDNRCVAKNVSNCLDVDSNCISCDENEKFNCTQCKENYLLNYVKNKCITESEIDCFYNEYYDPICEYCDFDNKTRCGLCAGRDYFFVVAANGTCAEKTKLTCEEIVENCADCHGGYCYGCKEKYAAVAMPGYPDRVKYCIHIDEVKCYQYIKNCVECDENNQSLCAKCVDGYYPSKDKSSCDRIYCDLYCCDVCDINQNCLKINENYIIVNNNCTRVDYVCNEEIRETCNKCDENGTLCYLCMWGYYLENNICVRGECSKKDDKDQRCYACSATDNETCVICNPGYYRNDDNYDCMKYQCPRKDGKRERCDLCDGQKKCLSCKEGYELLNDDCYDVEKCPQSKIDRCEICEANGNCITCKPGYSFNNITFDCDKIICPDENEKLERCDKCDINGNCLSCKPDNDLEIHGSYCYSTICPSTVENCKKCFPGGVCKECMNDYLLIYGVCTYHPSHGCLQYDENGKDCLKCDTDMGFLINNEKICIKLPEIEDPPDVNDEEIVITESENVIVDDNTKTVEINTNIGNLDKDKKYLIEIDSDISTIKIDNTEYKINLIFNDLSNVNIQPADGVTEPKFDIILNTNYDVNCSINLPSTSSLTSIKGKGNVVLSSNKESININSIEISSNSYLNVFQKVPTIYDELNLYGSTLLEFYNEDSKSIATANKVNVGQRGSATLKNVNIKKLNIELYGKLNLNENVNLNNSDIEIAFDDTQGLHILPLTGQISSVPKSLKLTKLNKNINNFLANDEYVAVAEFYYNSFEFCPKWVDSINNKYEPHPVYKYAMCNGNELRLVKVLPTASPVQNPGNSGSESNNKDGMNPGIIAAIVIACIVVVVVVILILYFFVFRKRKAQSSSAENANNEEV